MERRHRGRRELIGVALVAIVLATAVLGARWASVGLPLRGGHPYVSLYDPPRIRLEALLDVGDSQSYAALAQDPTLARPEVFNASANDASHAAEAAYRAQRPLMGWLGWIGSLGQPGAVPLVLVVLTALGAGVLAVGAALACRSLGRRADLAPAVLVVPGSLVLLAWTGPEALATGLALAGMVLWPRSRRWAVVLFTVAAFGRESMLLFPLGLAVDELIRRRDVRALVVPFAAWGGWVAVVHARLGEWPTAAESARVGTPFLSILQGARSWSGVGFAVFALGAVLAASALLRLDGPWRMVVLAHLAFLGALGANVWMRWDGFSRVLLPLYVLGAIALLPRRPAAAEPGPTVTPLVDAARCS